MPIKLYIWSTALIFLFSCSKNNHQLSPSSLRIETNVTEIYADGLDELVVKVFVSENQLISSGAEILIDGNPIIGNIFKTNTAKNYSVKARIGSKESASVSFNAIRHEINKFSKKIILEKFSGAWCGLCPQYTYKIDTMAASNNKIIPVSIHSGDALAYIFELQMRTQFGLSSFPAGYLNRAQTWDESIALLQTELNKKSKCGLALNTSVSNNQVTTTIKIKFDVTTSESLSLVVALLEDSIIYPQSNYFNTTFGSPFFGAGDPILNYKHNNTIRAAATDIFGDPLPVSTQKKNEIWEKTFVLNATGYDVSKSKIVAFLFYSINNASRFGVLNAQVVKAGNSIGFD